jgi:mRNA-capping enzyme
LITATNTISITLQDAANRCGTIGNVGLVIDASSEDLHDTEEWSKHDIRYIRLDPARFGAAKEGNQVHPESQAQFLAAFNKLALQFVENPKNEGQLIGVCCTYGFNFAGLLITSFLVEEFGSSLEASMGQYAEARAPGLFYSPYCDYLADHFSEKVCVCVCV